MPTSITSSGITFDDATTQTTSATKAGGIGTTQLADSSVTTAKINNAAVTAAKLDGAQTGSAPIYGCRAWVVFNGTTTPPTILASGNVSSVTRSSTGIYFVNFTIAMPDSSYSAVATSGLDNFVRTDSATTDQVRVVTASVTANSDRVSVAIFR